MYAMVCVTLQFMHVVATIAAGLLSRPSISDATSTAFIHEMATLFQDSHAGRALQPFAQVLEPTSIDSPDLGQRQVRGQSFVVSSRRLRKLQKEISATAGLNRL